MKLKKMTHESLTCSSVVELVTNADKIILIVGEWGTVVYQNELLGWLHVSLRRVRRAQNKIIVFSD